MSIKAILHWGSSCIFNEISLLKQSLQVLPVCASYTLTYALSDFILLYMV